MAAALEMTFDQFAAYLNRQGEQVAALTFRQPLTAVKVLMAAEARDNFDQSRAPDGTAWLPLKRPSAKRGGASAKPLRDTDLLMASVTAQGRGHLEEMTDHSLVYGTVIAYAAVHQFGHTFQRPARQRARPWVFTTPDGRKIFTRRLRAHTQTIPARPFLGYSERMLDRIDRIFADWLGQQLL